MFDTIGRNDDDDASRRGFVALLISSLLVGGVGAFAVGWASYQVVERVTDPVESTEIAFLDPVPDVIPLPELPELPRGRPGPAGDVAEAGTADRVLEPEPDAPPEPEEPDTRIDRLPEPSPIANSVGTTGPPGSTSGVAGGTGDCPDCGGGGRGGGDLYVHSSELEARRRVEPRYPSEAMGMGLGEQTCALRLRVDEKGMSQVVAVERCDPVFHAEVTDALSRWRYYPKRVDGTKVPARTVVYVRFMP